MVVVGFVTVVGVVVPVDVSIVGTTVPVEGGTIQVERGRIWSVSSGSSISLSNNSSSSVISWSTHVSVMIVHVWLSSAPVPTSSSSVKEKLVPRVLLEKDLRSESNALAHVGLIKR